MKVLLVEDEIPASKRLSKLLSELEDGIEILDILDSVEDAVSWLNTMPHPDLLFLDIQLADGISFEILEKTNVECPVIFTTAFDHYAVRAFKVNSVDYLLKPIDPVELSSAWERFKSRSGQKLEVADLLSALKKDTSEGDYKERFLVKIGDQLKYIPTSKIAYFFVDDGQCYLMSNGGQKLPIDFSLDQLADELNPKVFFRISRKFFVNDGSIEKIHSWFNSRLKLELQPKTNLEVIVSRERVGDFKSWLDR